MYDEWYIFALSYLHHIANIIDSEYPDNALLVYITVHRVCTILCVASCDLALYGMYYL